MKGKTTLVDAVRLIRFAAILWVVYLAALGIINQSFGNSRRGNTETLYYILLGFVALLCLGLAYWPWVQKRLGRGFIPLIIAIITVMPIIATLLITNLFPRNPQLSTDGTVLRLLPFLLVGFLLVAWQYRWQYMLLIILGITGLNLSVIWSFPAPAPTPFRGEKASATPQMTGALQRGGHE